MDSREGMLTEDMPALCQRVLIAILYLTIAGARAPTASSGTTRSSRRQSIKFVLNCTAAAGGHTRDFRRLETSRSVRSPYIARSCSFERSDLVNWSGFFRRTGRAAGTRRVTALASGRPSRGDASLRDCFAADAVPATRARRYMTPENRALIARSMKRRRDGDAMITQRHGLCRSHRWKPLLHRERRLPGTGGNYTSGGTQEETIQLGFRSTPGRPGGWRAIVLGRRWSICGPRTAIIATTPRPWGKEAAKTARLVAGSYRALVGSRRLS